jgi:transcriptional regulator NrdR family protein
MGEEREWFKETMREEKQRMVHLRGGREPLTRDQWLIERRRAMQKPKMARNVLDRINSSIQQRLKEVEMKRRWERDMDR